MIKSEMYREYAQQCVELANTFASTEIRRCLLTMAQAWHRLAQAQELANALLEERPPDGIGLLPINRP